MKKSTAAVTPKPISSTLLDAMRIYLSTQSAFFLAKRKNVLGIIYIQQVIEAQHAMEVARKELTNIFINEWEITPHAFETGKYDENFAFHYALAIAVNKAMVDGLNLNPGDNEAMSLRLGERLETIIRNRSDGLFGRYIHSQDYEHVCVIDHVYFGINYHSQDDSFCTVKNLLTGKTVAFSNLSDLGHLKWI